MALVLNISVLRNVLLDQLKVLQKIDVLVCLVVNSALMIKHQIRSYALNVKLSIKMLSMKDRIAFNQNYVNMVPLEIFLELNNAKLLAVIYFFINLFRCIDNVFNLLT